MSSPLSPLTDRINNLRQMGGNAVQMLSHPGQTIQGWLAPPPAHEQAMQQMNQQTNMHNNDPANQSFAQNPEHRTGVLQQAAKRPMR